MILFKKRQIKVNSRTFISLFFGILDTQGHTLSYANEGQDIPFLFSVNNEIIPLNTHGIALGMKEEVSYKSEVVPINPCDRLLIYSDGIRGAMNINKEEFGINRLKQVVKNNNEESAAEMIEKIISDVNLHFDGVLQNDDITVVMLKRTEN